MLLHLLIAKNEINNTQVNDAQDIDIVMSMYNLMECSNIYS